MSTRRSKNILAALVANRTLSPDGLKWLTEAMDPFHDSALQPSGFPDMITSRSVVQCVPLQATVSAPGGSNWDCHIFHLPFSSGLNLPSGTNTSANLVPYLIAPNGNFTSTGVTATTQMWSGMNILTMGTGVDWWTDSSSLVTSN